MDTYFLKRSEYVFGYSLAAIWVHFQQLKFNLFSEYKFTFGIG